MGVFGGSHACLRPCACSSLCLARPCPRHGSDASHPPGSQERGSEPGFRCCPRPSLLGHVAPGWGWWSSRRERAAPLRAAGVTGGAPPAPRASTPRAPGPVSVLLSNVRFLCCFVCSSRLSGAELLSAALSRALRRHRGRSELAERALGVASASVGQAVPL